MSIQYEQLKDSFDRLHNLYKAEISSDPIQFPKMFVRREDQEIVAFISALYAFGHVKMIFNTLRNILAVFDGQPHAVLTSMSEKKIFSQNFVQHRWISSSDTQSFLWLIRNVIEKNASLQNSFLRFYRKTDDTLERAINDWVNDLQQTLIRLQKKPLTRGQKFLLSSPSKGSTSKRLMMFFRWMVRDEEPDLGLWKEISPSQLLMPLDTHLFRFATYLGFIKRRQHGWKAVVEATSHFKKIDHADPVRYDFALARLGILNLCTHKVQRDTCGPCVIRAHCKLFQRSRKAKVFDFHL